MREIGLPTSALNGTYFWRLLNATLVFEIDKQIDYHRKNGESSRRVDRVLHVVENACFIITFGILAIFLAAYLLEYQFGELSQAIKHQPTTWLGKQLILLKPWLIFWTAGLPALGAALAGIRVQGAFEDSVRGSNSMVSSLISIKADSSKAMTREISLDETSELLISTARTMSEDIAAWQELFGRKRLVLPA